MELTSPAQNTLNTQPFLARLAPRETLENNETLQTPSQKMMMTNPPRSRSSSRATCLGPPNPMTLQLPIATLVAKKPVGYSEPTIKTYPKPNSSLKLPPTLLPVFPLPSGNESSKMTQLTSTKSLHHYIMLSLMKRERATWETQKSCLELLKARNVFVTQ